MERLIRKGYAQLRSKPFFATDDVKIGINTTFGKNVQFNCKRVRIGDGVSFQDNITVNADSFEMGDYGTIYSNCFFPGPGQLTIGHNFWLGVNCVIDSQGGTWIGNNVGIGAHSQLWTHMKFGDVMAGCRFHSTKKLTIEDDAWLVGHCLVSPVTIKRRSLALLGSVVVSDLQENHVYGGVPVVDLTDRLGPQFADTSISERMQYMTERIEEFGTIYSVNNVDRYIKIVTDYQDGSYSGDTTVFNIKNRTYIKTGSDLEHRFIRFLLPSAKFVPVAIRNTTDR
ncbi:MAG TPA: hypothetical protein DCR97_14135 [Deltaproteobacteria bacterium]|nr:hypothetical protein [Deltaproteobacteria bacterium]